MIHACAKQKRGEAVKLDGIATNAFIYGGGTRMYVYLCVLFNVF